MQLRIVYLLSLLVLSLTACDQQADPETETVGPETWLPMMLGKVPFEAQIVLTKAEQRTGLMHRDSLPENKGMLFPYARPRQLSFWMKNTRIPLDIGFFDATGLLLEIHHLVPFDTTPTSSHGSEMQYALEMNDGWFAKNNLYPGQRLDMERLTKAMRRRGADSTAYGLETSRGK